MRTLNAVSSIVLLVLTATPAAANNCPNQSVRDYDVIVVGAGSSGIAAAIQAARRPRTTVALIEPSGEIGGQIVAAGVTSMDGGLRPPVESGLYKRYRDLIWNHYQSLGLSPSTCYFFGPTLTCSEPRVSRSVLMEMLADDIPWNSSLCLFLNKQVTAVLKTGNTVTGVQTGSGPGLETWTSRVLIDATEYGDVIPLTGAEYRVGKRQTSVPLPPGQPECIQDITQLAVIRDYSYVPQFPPVIPLPPFYTDERRNEFESMVSDVWSQFCPKTWTWSKHNEYRGMPNSNPILPAPPITRTGVNYANDYPGHHYHPACSLVWRGKLSIDFIEDAASRHATLCDAKLRTAQFLYYMTRGSEQPEWSVASDEGYASPNTCFPPPDLLAPIEASLPPIPYVRESRRIVSQDTLWGFEIQRLGPPDSQPVPTSHNHAESLAVGDYGTDLHNCSDTGDFETTTEFTETADHLSSRAGAFQIPFKTFIPLVIDGFLPAEKNLGYSRIASSAARLQPSTMLVGQAAGALAALAAKGYRGPIQPRSVRVLDVQRTLLEGEDPASLARQTFGDVPLGHQRWRDVQLVSMHEVMTDFALHPGGWWYYFRPLEPAAREVVVNALIKLFGNPMPPLPPGGPYVRRDDLAGALHELLYGPPLPPTPLGDPIFVDVTGPPYRGAIERLYSEGYVEPCSTSPMQFCPGHGELRDRLASMAARVMLKNWP